VGLATASCARYGKKTVIESADDWEALYQQSETRWERGEINPALLSWLADGHLTAGRILVPGCGRAPEPAFLAAQGFTVTGLDFAPSAIQHQQQAHTHPSLTFEQADVLHWQAPTRFDAVYEQTCLCALPPDQWPGYAAQIAHWLRPGGKLFALFMQTGREGGPPFHCELDVMRDIFTNNIWTWDDTTPVVSEHFNDKTEIGMVLTRK